MAGYNYEAKLAALESKVMQEIVALNGQMSAALSGVAKFEEFRNEDFPALRDSVNQFHTELRTREELKTKADLEARADTAAKLAAASKRSDRRVNIIGVFVVAMGVIGGWILTNHDDHYRASVQDAVKQTLHEELGGKK